MKKGVAVIVLFVLTQQTVLAQASFEYYWPLIRKSLTNSSVVESNVLFWIGSTGATAVANASFSTNWIGSTGKLAAANAVYSTNWIAVTGATAAVNAKYATNWINSTGALAAMAAQYATNWIAITGKQAAVDATYATNWIATNVVIIPPSVYHPTEGIWQMDYNTNMTIMSYVLAIEAGKWRINSSSEIVLSTNQWEDGLWTTNSIGEIVTRSLQP